MSEWMRPSAGRAPASAALAGKPRNVPRAHRFSLQMPVLFRQPGESEWREGTTENVSRSGILLRGNEPLPERATVEIRMTLPSQILGTQGASILCHAEIVRRVEPNGDARPGYAASICDYNLTPGFGT